MLVRDRETSDISLGGLRIRSTQKLRVGEILNVELRGETFPPVACTTEIVRIAPLTEGPRASFDVGLRFVALSHVAFKALVQVLGPQIADWDAGVPPSSGSRPSGKPPSSGRRVHDRSAELLERMRAGDYEGAHDLASAILVATPANLLVRDCRDKCREALIKLYASQLVPFHRVPVVIAEKARLEAEAIDHRAGFVLWLIDGDSCLDTVLDLCGMPRFDALRILHALVRRRIVRFL